MTFSLFFRLATNVESMKRVKEIMSAYGELTEDLFTLTVIRDLL